MVNPNPTGSLVQQEDMEDELSKANNSANASKPDIQHPLPQGNQELRKKMQPKFTPFVTQTHYELKSGKKMPETESKDEFTPAEQAIILRYKQVLKRNERIKIFLGTERKVIDYENTRTLDRKKYD